MAWCLLLVGGVISNALLLHDDERATKKTRGGHVDAYLLLKSANGQTIDPGCYELLELETLLCMTCHRKSKKMKKTTSSSAHLRRNLGHFQI